jgi:hypothetical protein
MIYCPGLATKKRKAESTLNICKHWVFDCTSFWSPIFERAKCQLWKSVRPFIAGQSGLEKTWLQRLLTCSRRCWSFLITEGKDMLCSPYLSVHHWLPVPMAEYVVSMILNSLMQLRNCWGTIHKFWTHFTVFKMVSLAKWHFLLLQMMPCRGPHNPRKYEKSAFAISISSGTLRTGAQFRNRNLSLCRRHSM